MIQGELRDYEIRRTTSLCNNDIFYTVTTNIEPYGPVRYECPKIIAYPGAASEYIPPLLRVILDRFDGLPDHELAPLCHNGWLDTMHILDAEKFVQEEPEAFSEPVVCEKMEIEGTW